MSERKALSTEGLKKYVQGVFEAELNVYEQEQVLSRMRVTYGRLGIPAKISKSKDKEPETIIVDRMVVAGMIIGPIFGIIMGIVEYCSTATA